MTKQTVLITGANRGLGLGLVNAFLEDGDRVIALSRNPLPATVASGASRLEAFQCDLTDDRQLGLLAKRLAGRTIDVLINNAGMMAKAGFEAGKESVQGFGHFNREIWRRLFDINLFTAMSLAELLVENIARAERGRIVTISSMLGSMKMNTSGGIYAYRASKAGVNAIMKSMSIDLADRGIIAVAQHPGWVRTDMGGAGADIGIETSVRGMKAVIDGLTIGDSGKFLSYDGTEMPW